MGNFKLIAVDMDGTLLREDKTISDRTSSWVIDGVEFLYITTLILYLLL